MRYLILVFLAVGYVVSQGQSVQMPGEGDLDGIRVVSAETYSGQGLYGYIDGGADLYLEYGFVKLFVTDYSWENETLRAEVWIMDDAPSAYGIYALSHSTCLVWNSLSSFSCTSRYQSAATSGPLFISVTNSTGTQAAQGMCSRMVQKILEKNPQETWYMPALFQSEKLKDYTTSIRYFEGPLGVQNGIPVMSDLMEDLQYKMYTMIMTGIPSMIARIEFPDNGTARTFLSRARLDPVDYTADPIPAGNGMYRSWYKISDTKIIYLESSAGNITLKDYIPKSPPPYWLDN